MDSTSQLWGARYVFRTRLLFMGPTPRSLIGINRAPQCRTLYLIKEGEVRVAVPVEGTKRAELVERRAKGEDSAGASGGSPSQVLQAMARRQRTQPGAAASPKRRQAPLNVAREAPHADVLALLDEEAATSKMWVLVGCAGAMGCAMRCLTLCHDRYGSQMDVALLGKGNVIGLQDMLGDTTISTSTVTANTSVRTLALPFSALLEKLPALPVRTQPRVACRPCISLGFRIPPSLQEVMEALRAAAEEYTQKWTSYSKRVRRRCVLPSYPRASHTAVRHGQSDALIGDIRRSLTYAIRETKREHDSTLRHIKIRPAVEEEREAKEVDKGTMRDAAGTSKMPVHDAQTPSWRMRDFHSSSVCRGRVHQHPQHHREGELVAGGRKCRRNTRGTAAVVGASDITATVSVAWTQHACQPAATGWEA